MIRSLINLASVILRSRFGQPSEKGFFSEETPNRPGNYSVDRSMEHWSETGGSLTEIDNFNFKFSSLGTLVAGDTHSFVSKNIMGKIIGNTITSSFSGALGDDLVFRKIGSRTFFARKGVNRKPPTPSQNSRRNLFAEAQEYASGVLMQPGHSEWYSIVAKVNKLRTAQLAAVKDFMTSPEIDSIDTKKYEGRPGDIIHIKPKVLLKIEKMEITIHSAEGTVLESGWAVKNGFDWKYRATVINPHVTGSKVIVVAHDRLEKSCTVVTHLY